jgi:hypothetical protein
MVGVCWAFGSSVAALVEEAQKTGGFQIYGAPEKGKTTALILAGSVWGRHVGQNGDRGFAESWNTTDNQVEEIIAGHTHVGLMLDEAHLYGGDFAKAVMRLSEGTGKQRMNQGGATTFEALFFSTSNVPSWELIASAKQPVIEAVLSRICDIPLPKGGDGIFEELHGFDEGRDLSNTIKVESSRHYGCAGRMFIERLVQDLATENASNARLAFLRERRKRYLKALHRRAEELRVLERPADRMATIYAAGCLAVEYGILPWRRKDVREAILSCHLDAIQAAQPCLLAVRNQRPAPQSGLERLRAYVAQNRRDFVNLDKTPLKFGVDTFGAAKGYSATFKKKKWFYFSADQLKQIVGGAREYRVLCDKLASQVLLARSGNAMTTQRPVFSGGEGNQNFARVVAIRRKVLRRPT